MFVFLMNNRKGQRNTATRTIRLTDDLNSILEKDSADKRVSINLLIGSILTRYAEWDRYTEKIGFISLPREGLKMMIESIDEERIKQFAEELASRHPQEYMMFWFKRTDPNAFLEGMSLFCRYAGFAKYEIETLGRDYIVVLHRDMGRKWSIFLSHIITQGIEKILRITPKFDMTDHSVILRFLIP